MATGLSLANKSQLLFGFAVVLILGAALSMPWFFIQYTVRAFQLEFVRQLADTWLSRQIGVGSIDRATDVVPVYDTLFEEPVRLTVVRIDEIEPLDLDDSFFRRAYQSFRDDDEATEYGDSSRLEGQVVYHYARAIRDEDWRRIQDREYVEMFPGSFDPAVVNRLRAILLIDRRSEFSAGQLLRGQMYIIASWLFASLLAVLVFYLILTKLIFSPVRRLRDTVEKVEAGDTAIRADIRTGDEFEQLSDAFNVMLARLLQSQMQLRTINENLDLKVTELAEANIGLYESNRLKGEFLANVSHELRTPLNSIIGFADLLNELARAEVDADPKRRRYLENIHSSARSLLEMINDLLEMAKIEAGRVEINIESTSIPALVEGLRTVMRPQAEAKRVVIETRMAENLPVIDTDPGKVQQILYNFLSNAIKFSDQGDSITIAAERMIHADGGRGVRLGVIDSGPGIPEDMQDTIFEKFRQVDASHTRSHQGAGLGLAICRELAQMIGGRLSLDSAVGRGAAFYVDLPLVYQPDQPQSLMG